MVIIIISFVVQILVEMIPVSSSGTVTLMQSLGNLFFDGDFEKNFSKYYGDIVQWPTVFVLGIYFFPLWSEYLKQCFSELSASLQKKRLDFPKSSAFFLVFCIIVADCVTAGLYMILSYIGVAWWPLWLGFACTTVIVWCTSYIGKRYEQENQWTISKALILGFSQGFALLPGVSRLGTTFFVARLLGFSAKKAFEYSFLLEWPLIVAAGMRGLWHALDVDSAIMGQLLSCPFLFSTLSATIVSYGILRWSALLSQKKEWRYCAVYTALCSIIAWWVL